MSKVWVVPGLSIIIAAKNWSYPAMVLQMYLSCPCDLSTWAETVEAAPAILLAAASSQAAGVKHASGCRVVMFGWDEARGEVAGCLFEGAMGFVAQPMAEGEMLMPAAPDLPGDDWQRVEAQQAYDLALPLDEQDNIGGPVIRTELVAIDGAPVITTRCIGVLPILQRPSGAYAGG